MSKSRLNLFTDQIHGRDARGEREVEGRERGSDPRHQQIVEQREAGEVEQRQSTGGDRDEERRRPTTTTRGRVRQQDATRERRRGRRGRSRRVRRGGRELVQFRRLLELLVNHCNLITFSCRLIETMFVI